MSGCCPWCMCKVCSSLGQKWGNERAITGIKIILTCSLKQTFTRSDFKVPFLWWECRKVICSVFTRSDFHNWQRIFNLAPKRSQGYHAKCVGVFHLSRRVLDENRACSISIRFSKLRIRVSEGHFQCVHTIRFSEPTKIGSLKNGSCERAYRTNKYIKVIETRLFLMSLFPWQLFNKTDLLESS